MKIRTILLVLYIALSLVYIVVTIYLDMRLRVYQSGLNDGVTATVQQTMMLAHNKPCEEIVIKLDQQELKMIESGCLEKKQPEKKEKKT